MGKGNIFWYVVLMVLGEFFIILDAGFIGYLMGNEYNLSGGEILTFWALLLSGIIFRLWAEKLNKK